MSSNGKILLLFTADLPVVTMLNFFSTCSMASSTCKPCKSIVLALFLGLLEEEYKTYKEEETSEWEGGGVICTNIRSDPTPLKLKQLT